MPSFYDSKAAPNKIVFWDSDRDILILTEILFKPSLNSALRGGEILFVGLFWLFRSRKQTNMQQTMCCITRPPFWCFGILRFMSVVG